MNVFALREIDTRNYMPALSRGRLNASSWPILNGGANGPRLWGNKNHAMRSRTAWLETPEGKRFTGAFEIVGFNLVELPE